MQWQYQIRPSRMSDGVVVTHAEEALRAVQDVLSLHKTIPPWHAVSYTHHRLLAPCSFTCCQYVPYLVQGDPGRFCLAGATAMVHASRLAQPLLGWRWWLGP